MSGPERCGVLIVGAGPAGCAAGIVLARAGVDVRVLDRARFPRDKICGDAISNDAVAQLEELGCGGALHAAPHAVVRAADARLPDGSVLRRTYARPGMIVPRTTLDDLLRRGLEASGARLDEGRAVRALRVERGRVVGATGPGLDVRAEIVIAADGHGSVSWPRLGRPAARSSGLGVALRAYLEGVHYPDGEDVAEHCFLAELPRGYAWVFPAVRGVANAGIYQRADAFVPGPTLERLFDAFLAQRPDRFARAREVAPRRTWPLPLAGGFAHASAPGLLVVGDAARVIDPLSGEGIWQALTSGVIAAETACRAMRGGGLGWPARARYALELQRRLGLAGFARARVQEGLDVVFRLGLHRRAGVRAALGWGYRGGLLEITKS